MSQLINSQREINSMSSFDTQSGVSEGFLNKKELKIPSKGRMKLNSFIPSQKIYKGPEDHLQINRKLDLSSNIQSDLTIDMLSDLPNLIQSDITYFKYIKFNDFPSDLPSEVENLFHNPLRFEKNENQFGLLTKAHIDTNEFHNVLPFVLNESSIDLSNKPITETSLLKDKYDNINQNYKMNNYVQIENVNVESDIIIENNQNDNLSDQEYNLDKFTTQDCVEKDFEESFINESVNYDSLKNRIEKIKLDGKDKLKKILQQNIKESYFLDDMIDSASVTSDIGYDLFHEVESHSIAEFNIPTPLDTYSDFKKSIEENKIKSSKDNFEIQNNKNLDMNTNNILMKKIEISQNSGSKLNVQFNNIINEEGIYLPIKTLEKFKDIQSPIATIDNDSIFQEMINVSNRINNNLNIISSQENIEYKSFDVENSTTVKNDKAILDDEGIVFPEKLNHKFEIENNKIKIRNKRKEFNDDVERIFELFMEDVDQWSERIQTRSRDSLSENSNKKIIKKSRISAEQKFMLQDWYNKNDRKYLNKDEIMDLGIQTGLSKKQIRGWLTRQRFYSKSNFSEIDSNIQVDSKSEKKLPLTSEKPLFSLIKKTPENSNKSKNDIDNTSLLVIKSFNEIHQSYNPSKRRVRSQTLDDIANQILEERKTKLSKNVVA